MTKKSELSVSNHVSNERLSELKDQIDALRAELELIRQSTHAFETQLRAHLINELIEEQELTVLYKQQKLAKKEQRLAQKRRGKNYVAPEGLKPVVRNNKPGHNESDQKEMKRIYREAMMHVHPDKFSMDGQKMEVATDVTARLISIYQSGDLAALRAYHAHIFSDQELVSMMAPAAASVQPTAPAYDYLEQEKLNVEQELARAKSRQTYRVLTTYDDPMTFLEELKVYYDDRIAKLRRRTRS
ncbi:hypothetical protein [Marinoscillum sp. 108]|uniref:hypothetical protein n=1 Tax=Marinoscillum sp. 108 TaxID=2653151 RepID=UPI0012EEFB6D|nr:hypothetical protein [Marinoscillum sp. 108]VXD13780.1 conserved hypothetical protein [Marinoscillum sp. 108]